MKPTLGPALLRKLKITAISLAKKWGHSGAWEDIYSDMCYAYIRKKEKLADKPEAYVIVACKNEAINNYKRGKSVCSKPRSDVEIVSIHMLSEHVPAQSFFEKEIHIKILVEEIFDTLTLREKQVATLMFDGYTEREIAALLSISQQRINRIKKVIRSKACRILNKKVSF